MRISAGSLAFSWIIALFLLAGIGMISRPPLHEDRVQIIPFPALTTAPDAHQIAYLRARVWCALEGNQVASINIQGQEQRFRGAMAIAPQWRGDSLPQKADALVKDCVHSRIDSHDVKSKPGNGVPASLAFAFSHL